MLADARMSEKRLSEAEDEVRKRINEEAVSHFRESEHPFEDGARSFLNHIESCANISLMPPGSLCLPEDEYATLKFASEELRPAFDELVKWFIEPLRETQPSRCEYGYQQIGTLLGAAFHIGTHGTVTEGAKNYFRPQISDEIAPEIIATTKKFQTQAAIEARRAPHEIIKTIIKKHANELWKKKPSFNSNKSHTAEKYARRSWLKLETTSEICRRAVGYRPTKRLK
jgi:hypothetical protein